MIDLERIVALDPGGTTTPLFCVHSSSGSAYSYLELARLLGTDRPVYGLEAPGFDGDREPLRSVAALSAEYAETLRAFRPEDDFVLLGWSMGGVIAFDLAQRLTTAGARVRQLILIDVSVPRVAELPPEKEIVRRFLEELLASLGTGARGWQELLAAQPDEATSEALFLAADRAGGLPPELDTELLSERYAVFRAHVEASYGYQVTGQYHGPVLHLIAARSQAPHMHWNQAAPDLTEHVVPGSHHSIWDRDGLPLLAELVRDALDDALPPQPRVLSRIQEMQAGEPSRSE